MPTPPITLKWLMQQLISQYQANGQLRTAETYATTLNSFMRFSQGTDMTLSSIDSLLIRQYESWLLHKTGVTFNTSSFYMRKLRAAYNVAVERGLAEPRNPFKNVYTGKDKTAKRAVPLAIIKKVKQLDLSSLPRLELARDLFMFSFYTRGMAFIDMAYLKKVDLQSGRLIYRRHKTGQLLTVKLETCIQQIIRKYDGVSDTYLLPIIKDNNNNERAQYKRMQYRINHALKQLSQIAGITRPLTMYVARHSWASIAWAKNIPTSTISDGLGHSSEQTTRIYLASLDASGVDRANKRILDEL